MYINVACLREPAKTTHAQDRVRIQDPKGVRPGGTFGTLSAHFNIHQAALLISTRQSEWRATYAVQLFGIDITSKLSLACTIKRQSVSISLLLSLGVIEYDPHLFHFHRGGIFDQTLEIKGLLQLLSYEYYVQSEFHIGEVELIKNENKTQHKQICNSKVYTLLQQ